MKKLLLISLFASLIFSCFVSNGQTVTLAKYEFEDVASATSVDANVTATNATVSTLSIAYQNGTDDGGIKIGNSGTWNMGNFDSTGKYLEFSISANSGYGILLEQVNLRFGRTNTGPTKVTVQYSLDGFATAGTTILSDAVVTSTNAALLDPFSITTNFPSFATSQTITVRVWGHNATGTGNLRFNNLELLGQVKTVFPITIAPVVGGTAVITTIPALNAEAAEVVSVNISDIQIGKEFVSITVIGADFTPISTTEITAGVDYTFIMPTQAVTIAVVLQDVSGFNFAISTSVVGGTATIATTPATQTTSGTTVTVDISSIVAGKEFVSIAVIGTDLSPISTTEITAGVQYTFTMPAQAVDITVTLQDIPAVTYAIATMAIGGTATITTSPATVAEEAETVTVDISSIEAGKEFVSIVVVGADFTPISTTEITAGVQYTFTMPAQAVDITVTLQDIPAVTYAIATLAIGGTATITTSPATVAEEAETVTVTIASIEVGKQFLSIEVVAFDLSVIATTEVTLGEEYTFEMPAQAVTVNVTLEDILVDPIIINTQPQSETICSYDFATISIDAEVNTAETLTYQWYYNGAMMTDSISSSIMVNLGGEYFCILTAGTDELVSETAVLTVATVNPELPTDLVVCTGSTYILNPGTFDSYEWNDMTTDPTLSVTADGTYSVIVEDANGCTATAESIVSFSDVISIDLGEAANVCEGSTTTISAPVSDSYLWGGSEDTQEIIVSEEGWYFVTVTQGTCEANDSIFLTVNNLPEEFSFQDIFACDGTTVTIDGPTQTGLDYNWSTGAITSSIEVTSTDTYFVTVTNENNCERSANIYVEFNSFVYIDLHETDSIKSCQGETVTLGPIDGIAWLWNNASTSSTLSVTTSAWYYVTVTVAGGCQGNDSVYVLFNALPVIDLGTNQAFCDGLSTELTAPDAVSYLWNTGETTQSITIDTASIYSCTITDVNGCVNSDQMSLSIYPLPIVDLGADMLVDDDQIIVLGAQLGHPNYLWTTGETTNFITIDADTLNQGINTISLTVTSSNGCSVTDEIIITVIPGVGVDTENAENYSVFPNPSNGIIEISGNNIDTINIMDYTGKLVLSSSQSIIDLSNLAKGIYIIQINTKSNNYTSKIVLQ